MPKTIVLVGHCGPDSSYLRMVVSKAARGAQVVAADDSGELQHVLSQHPDLLLLNRELGYGFAEQMGVDLVRELRHSHPTVKTMLVTNYPDVQAEAQAAGALPGFGKRELGSPRVVKLIQSALGELE